MSEANSTPAPARSKPATTADNRAKAAKPYPDYPLTPHPTGRWCKKIRGRIHYFGPISDPDGALQSYLEQKDDLHAGRTPRTDPDALTVKKLVDDFLYAKRDSLDTGELSARMYAHYECACIAIAKQFGKNRLVSDLAPDDFARLRRKLAERNGPHSLGNIIQCVRSVFKYAFDADWIDKPIRFGPGFKRPSKKTLRIHRAKQGPKLFTAEEIRRMLGTARQPMRAMILLAINCGFGNADSGNLPSAAVDLDAAVIVYPRPKTGIARRCPLWPETVQAIRDALAERPNPKREADASLVFLTKYGLPWARNNDPGILTKEFRKLLDALDINGSRNFYTLRHAFRTVADEARDQPAADFIMGHESAHMSSHYRERISDERLRAVAEYVRRWLFVGPWKEGDEA